jgi:hypothetical protein
MIWGLFGLMKEYELIEVMNMRQIHIRQTPTSYSQVRMSNSKAFRRIENMCSRLYQLMQADKSIESARTQDSKDRESTAPPCSRRQPLTTAETPVALAVNSKCCSKRESGGYQIG